MTDETSGNGYNIISTFLQMLSLDIPLIIIRAPIWLIVIVSCFILFPLVAPATGVLIRIIYMLLLRPGFYIIGLIIAIGGKQDFWSIAFYIAFGLQIYSIFHQFVGTIILIIQFFKAKKS